MIFKIEKQGVYHFFLPEDEEEEALAAELIAAIIEDIIKELNFSGSTPEDLAFNKLIISSIGIVAFCCCCCCCCFCLSIIASKASSEAFLRPAQYLAWCACKLLTDLNLIPHPSGYYTNTF